MTDTHAREEAALSRELSKQAGVLLLSLILSIVAGFVPSWTNVEFTVAEQTLLSLLTFVALAMLDVLWLGSKMAANQKSYHEVWEIEHEGDRYLSNIRSAYNKIAKSAYGRTDLFLDHLLKQMEDLSVVANDAANKGTLRVTGHHLTRSSFLVDVFGPSERILRYTWRIDPGERLFDDLHWRKYFEMTSSLAISQQLKAVRALLLVTDRKSLEAPHVQKLLEFFASNKGLATRIVLAHHYETLAVDNSVPSSCIDFGIYGDRLLYQAEQYDPSTIGHWSKDQTVIQRFQKFFDTLWTTRTIAAANPAAPPTKISLAELMAADETIGSSV